VSTLSWLQSDVQGEASDATLALIERLKVQRRDLAGIPDELSTILLGFWTGKVEGHAVQIGTDPAVRLFMCDSLDHVMARNVCIRLRNRKPNPVLACLVRGSSKYGIVLGCEHPPEGIEEWIMQRVEQVNPALTL